MREVRGALRGTGRVCGAVSGESDVREREGFVLGTAAEPPGLWEPGWCLHSFRPAGAERLVSCVSSCPSECIVCPRSMENVNTVSIRLAGCCNPSLSQDALPFGLPARPLRSALPARHLQVTAAPAPAVT